jgi:hypothetical protein
MLQAEASSFSHSISALPYLVFTVSINLFFQDVKVSERSNVHSPLQLILPHFLHLFLRRLCQFFVHPPPPGSFVSCRLWF